jgi:hypothetical protein
MLIKLLFNFIQFSNSNWINQAINYVNLINGGLIGIVYFIEIFWLRSVAATFMSSCCYIFRLTVFTVTNSLIIWVFFSWFNALLVSERCCLRSEMVLDKFLEWCNILALIWSTLLGNLILILDFYNFKVENF